MNWSWRQIACSNKLWIPNGSSFRTHSQNNNNNKYSTRSWRDGVGLLLVRFNYHGKYSLVLGNRNRLQYYHKPLNNPIPIFNSIPSIYLVSLLGQQNFSRFSFSAFPLIFIVFSLYLSGSSQFCYPIIIILFSNHNESILRRIVHWNSSPHVLPLIDAVLLLIHLYRKLKSRFGDKSRWRVIICCKQL